MRDDEARGEISPMEALRALYGVLSRRRRGHLLAMLGVMLLGAVAEVVTIGSAMPFLLLVLTPGRASSLPVLPGTSPLGSAALLLAAAALGATGVRILLSSVSQGFAYRVGHDLGTAMFHRMLRRPYAYHVSRNTSELLVGIDKVQMTVVGVLLPAVQAVSAGVLALCIIAFLFVLQPYAAAAGALVMTVLYGAITRSTGPRLRRNSLVVSQAATARMKLVREGLGGIRDILLDQSQPVFEDDFRELDARFRRAQAANALISVTPRYLVECAALLLMAGVAVVLNGRGGVTGALPVLGAFVLGAQRLMPLLQQVYLGWSSCVGNFRVVRDLLALLHAPVAPALPPSAEPLPFAREIHLDDVSFRYGGGEYALREVSLRIPRGARVGVVGRSGSGKSTLLDLLMGLLEPTSGAIRVDGVPLDDATRPRWQREIAHVPQAIYLTDRSIAANIAFGEPEDRIDMARVEAAARGAEIHDFVQGLPEGFGTRVGERGVQLSGGQRQRVGIARALYKRASLLIFDEVTSALDEATEEAVMRSIAAIESGRTVVIVTHRASNLDGCDFIVRMDRGRIAP